MTATPATSAALRIENVRKSYGPRRVLSGITLDAGPGDVVAVVGPNGSGKSTLLKIVAGLLRPTKGAVGLTLGGREVSEVAERRRAVGYAAPDLTLYPELSGRENLQFFAAVRGEPLSDEEAGRRLEAVGLGGRGGDPVSVYSSGMRQRLRLAFAWRGGDVPLLLLDEPSLALDEKGVGLIAEMVDDGSGRGAVTLIATNDAREAALAGRRVVLGN